jgi:hypothetical protein
MQHTADQHQIAQSAKPLGSKDWKLGTIMFLNVIKQTSFKITIHTKTLIQLPSYANDKTFITAEHRISRELSFTCLESNVYKYIHIHPHISYKFILLCGSQG